MSSTQESINPDMTDKPKQTFQWHLDEGLLHRTQLWLTAAKDKKAREVCKRALRKYVYGGSADELEKAIESPPKTDGAKHVKR
jgi:hypothetical protein